MREEIAKGRQVYVVYPMIEETETLDLEELDVGIRGIKPRFSGTASRFPSYTEK
jgi:ATP-dependent DNA helicase RecG